MSAFILFSNWNYLSALAHGPRYGVADAKQNGETPTTNFAKNNLDDGNLTIGVCDTAGPIEVEGTILGTTPTAYATLGAAFTAINTGTHTGAITIEVCGDSAGETSAILNASGSGSASYTSIAIRPVGGVARAISGSNIAGPMIDFNGADNVTVDGLNAGGNSLTIANTSTSATSTVSTIRFIGGATNNTITNSNIHGSGTMSVATNGAIIFFSTDAVTTAGNDNNTISNNNIGPSGANVPTKGILCNGSQSTQAIGNSGLIIDNNNIFDFFGAAVTSAGIAVNGGCNTFSITNNRFYQTGTKTWTTGALHTPILMNSAAAVHGVQGMTITGNIIGYASNTQTGTYALTGSNGTFRGIQFNGLVTGATSNINSNTVASVSVTGVTSSGTGTSSPFMGVYIVTGPVTTNGNTIGSQSATGSLNYATTSASAADVSGIFNAGANDWTTNSNNVGGILAANAGTGAANIYGIRGDTASTVLWTCNNNTVGGTVASSLNSTSTSNLATVHGIRDNAAALTAIGNVVRNLTTAGGSGHGVTASVIGIGVNSGGVNHTVGRNTIYNLSNSHATDATDVTGIYFTGSTANVVERNLIHSLTLATNSSLAELNGIRAAGGTTIYRNNMIAIGAGVANAIGVAATNTSDRSINGIHNDSSQSNEFYHNSVYIGGSPTAGSGASYAFMEPGAWTNARSIRDNIFFNARSNGGAATGKNYAVKFDTGATGLTINNNLYFTNGSGGVFGFFGADVANLAAWQTALGQDANSFESNPQYLGPTNATPNLHLDAVAPSDAKGNGADVGVINDFDGDVRANWLPLEIGADEVAPTAGPASISGRVMTGDGRGIRNATVMLSSDGNSAPIYARTGSFGYYEFQDVASGRTYVLTVRSKRFEFANPTRVVFLVNDLSDFNFIADPAEGNLRGGESPPKQ